MDETTTRIPAVIDALVAVLRDALPGVAVLDGPPVGSDWPFDFLTVAASNDEAAYTSDVERAPGLGNRLVETFKVNLLAWSFRGDAEMKPRRDAVYEMVAAVDAALKADQTLGGACDVATRGGEAVGDQVQYGEGAAHFLTFSVVGRALL